MFKRLLNLFESQKNLQIMLSSGSGSPGKGSGNVGGGGGSKGTPPKKRFTFTKPGNSSGKVMVNDVYLFLQYFHKLDYLSSFRCIDGCHQGWRISRHTNADRGLHVRFENTEFSEANAFRAALGPEAYDRREGFAWDRNGRYWWVRVAAVAQYVQDGGEAVKEEDVTDEFLVDLVRAAASASKDN